MLRSANAPPSSSPSSESGPKLNMPWFSGTMVTPGERTAWSGKTWLGSMWPKLPDVANAEPPESAPVEEGNMGLPLAGLYMNWLDMELPMCVVAGLKGCVR